VLTTVAPSTELGEEGYELNVSPNSIDLRASSSAGLFYGVKSLLQLLPPEIFAQHQVPRRKWKIPCLTIQDKPRFVWRGLMLDVSRHFLTKNELKQLMREMALHKLNVFHWPLTDDQGWRIEIKRYPRLIDVGAWRWIGGAEEASAGGHKESRNWNDFTRWLATHLRRLVQLGIHFRPPDVQ